MVVLFGEFGFISPYTGHLNARLLRKVSDMQIIQLFSYGPSQNPETSSYLPAAYVKEFSEGTKFPCVVNLGVGSNQLAAVVKAKRKWFVGPGNGFLRGCVAGWFITPGVGGHMAACQIFIKFPWERFVALVAALLQSHDS